MRHDPIDPAGAGNPSSVCAAFVMSRPPITVRARASIDEAMSLMSAHRVHYLPVVEDGGRLLGIVNADDLRRGQSVGETRVGTVMATPVIAIDCNTPVAEAVRLMALNGVGALPVLDGGCVVGILTQSDVVARVTGKLA